MVIERNKDRVKKTGEIFTPDWLVDEMLMKLQAQDPTLFSDADKTFCDPACGDGNFLVRILYWKLHFNKERAEGKKVPAYRILKSIYGVDLMPDNVRQCRVRLLDVAADFLKITHKEASSRFSEILNGRTRGNMKPTIACHDALKWDFENWCPKGSTENVAKETQGMIVFEQPVVKEVTVEDILGGVKPTKPTKETKVISPRQSEILGQEFFKY